MTYTRTVTHAPGTSPEGCVECIRCDHAACWHRLDDSLNISPTDPAAPFRCLGPYFEGCNDKCPDIDPRPPAPTRDQGDLMSEEDWSTDVTDWPATNYTDEPLTALIHAAAERLRPTVRSLRENNWQTELVVRRDPETERVTMCVELLLAAPSPQETGRDGGS